MWQQGSRDPGQQHDDHDLQGERAVIDEQPDQLAKDPFQRVHGKTSAVRRRTSATPANPTARKRAAKTTIARSAPGQATPRPSPVQNSPNADRIKPTAHLSEISGTRVKERMTSSV